MSGQTRELADACSDVANNVAEGDFVAVRRLVENLGAQLSARPLLCEGMLAAPLKPEGKWLVLVDSEHTGYDEARYREEKSENALPARLRFTVAHELSHLIQFTRSGPAGNNRKGSGKGKAEDVGTIERQADRLSPLLLIAEDALERLAAGEGRLHLADWIKAQKRWGVSREVLIQRLNLMFEFDRRSFRYKARFRNLILGMGEWAKPRQARLLDWPAPFRNLDGGMKPELLLETGPVGFDTLRAAFSDPTFCLNGGESLGTEAEIWIGTKTNPHSERRRFRFEIERGPGKGTGRFLYLLDCQ
jgi:hypothetical protein